MCNKCNSKELIDAGCINAYIESYDEGYFLEFTYTAYSLDSSFDGDEACIKINYCPICGKKLLGKI